MHQSVARNALQLGKRSNIEIIRKNFSISKLLVFGTVGLQEKVFFLSIDFKFDFMFTSCKLGDPSLLIFLFIFW